METVSLQKCLTEKYESVIANAEAAIIAARANLGRIAAIYGGQMTFDTLKDDQANTEPVMAAIHYFPGEPGK